MKYPEYRAEMGPRCRSELARECSRRGIQRRPLLRASIGILLLLSGLPCLAATPERGAVLEAATLADYSRADIDTRLGQRKSFIGTPRCDVRLVAVRYQTIGVKGEPATASAMLLVPHGEQCAGPLPLLGWARPTETRRDSAQADEALEDGQSGPADFFAAQGYVVVASDYLGLGHSDYTYHPYLHADSEASAVIDALRAARNLATPQGVSLSGKVMLAGYSQGGHAAMAAQRAIEKDFSSEFNLVASVPMSGPYAVENTFLHGWSGTSAKGRNSLAPYLFAYAAVAMQRVYGNLYRAPQELFQAPYAGQLEAAFPGTMDLSALSRTLRLPIDGLRQPAFVEAFAQDPANPLRQDLRQNDLLDWTPRTPTLLCGAGRDAVVEFANAETASAAFNARGAHVQVLNVDAQIPPTVDGVGIHTGWASFLCMGAARQQVFDQAR